MRLSECYSLLEAAPGASLDTIKANYRRLAFRYHPDLNAGDARAAERFTRVFGVRCLRLEEPWAEREYVLGVLRQQRLPTVVQRFVDTLIPRDKQ